MVPKESGFNQSETDSGKCARTVWRFQARLPRKGMAKLYKGRILVIMEAQFAIESQVT